MGIFQKEDQAKNVVEFVIYSVSIIMFIVIGFGVIGAQGIFNETQKLLFYLLLTFYNIVFIVYSGLAIFIKRMLKDGLQGEEIVHIITIMFGATMLIAGGIGIFKGEIPANLQPFVGLGLIIAGVLAMIQYFIVKIR